MKRQTKKLIEENDILCEQLSKEANDVLRNMTGYIQRFGISRYEQEKVRQDIAEMILEGEKRGIPVKNTIGEDYQAFCDSVLAEMPRMSSREKCLNVIRDICIFLAVWLPFWVLQYGGKDEQSRLPAEAQHGCFSYLPQDMYTAGLCQGRFLISILRTC